MKVKHSRNTVACKIGEEIFVHPELHKHPELYKAIIKHEQSHTHSFSFKDFLLDLTNEDLKGHKKEYYKFMLRHPRTFLGLLPLSKVGPYWAVDPTMLIFMSLTVALITLYWKVKL